MSNHKSKITGLDLNSNLTALDQAFEVSPSMQDFQQTIGLEKPIARGQKGDPQCVPTSWMPDVWGPTVNSGPKHGFGSIANSGPTLDADVLDGDLLPSYAERRLSDHVDKIIAAYDDNLQTNPLHDANYLPTAPVPPIPQHYPGTIEGYGEKTYTIKNINLTKYIGLVIILFIVIGIFWWLFQSASSRPELPLFE